MSMTTKIIVFTKDAIQYDMEKQLRSIKLQESYAGRETDEHRIFSSFDVEKLDEAIVESADKKTKLIVLLEESLETDRLERLIHEEYGQLFEEIEVIPEKFYRTLREADQQQQVAAQPQQQAQQTATNDQLKDAAQSFVIFPYNPLIKGVNAQGCSNFAKTYSLQQGYRALIYQPAQQRTRFFCMSATTLAMQFIERSLEQIDKNAVYAPSAKALAMMLGQKSVSPQQVKIFIPADQTYAAIEADFKAAGFTQIQQINMQFVQSQPAIQLYNLCVELSKKLQDKSLKEDTKAVQKHLSDIDGVSKAQLVIELVAAAEYTANSYKDGAMSADQRAKLWHDFRMSALAKLGVNADLSRMFKELDDHGLGLVTDAIHLAAKAYQTHKEANAKNKKVDKRNFIVSWEKYETILSLLPDKVLEQEGAKEVAKLNAEKSKTLGQKSDTADEQTDGIVGDEE